MTEFNQGDFYGSNALWDYVVVNASLRSYIIRHDQSGFSRPRYKGKLGEINDIHNVVNKIIAEFNQGGCSWVQCLEGLHGC
jgi:hypothetical protein